MCMSSPLRLSIEDLRQRMAPPLETSGAVLPFGDRRIDRHLPGGGLPLGQLHEIGADGIEAQTGAIMGGFAAALGAHLLRHDRDQRVLLWITSCCDLYAPGLLSYGIDPGRLIVVHTSSDTETLDAMETALRSGAAAAVLGEAGTLPRLAARRLQLACLHAQTTGLLLRRWPYGCKAPAEPAAAVTRWRVCHVRTRKEGRGLCPPLPIGTPLESGDPRPRYLEHVEGSGRTATPRLTSPFHTLQRSGVWGSPTSAGSQWEEGGRALDVLSQWHIELRHARGGRAGAWIMELGDAASALRVVAVLGDDQVAPRPQRAVA